MCEEEIDQERILKNKSVYVLHCSDCNAVLCKRGMRAMLLADINVQLFSTDRPLDTVQLASRDYFTLSCRCMIRDVACYMCGNIVGYHVSQPCKKCLNSRNNGHLWIFDMEKIAWRKRCSIQGSILRWNVLCPYEIENEDEIVIR
ncbi:FAM72-like protein [Hamiltosporidium tvaerminnensis]|uniref:FAM72-like protein n=2 Tax=Hamiltosporidium TaxID=1176354 RepID=A0A4Q9KYH3_9MICR|nr:hypothetical protein LUQ84_002824 [Hamiltosporidium tvaerminnensis]TBT98045.1 FAM72-like protein [Hamiltosporidium magnivora]TBT98155.1 FAM72-like protein [Hamiltosporidium tvaerminnensis]TBU00039.1 FAM72-like protein [Hamiltosporidium magnivora]TBU11266.1 FAM72-like protein [Hamiltosporidium tvaerminnensis]